MKIPLQKGEHSCKCTELSLTTKDRVNTSLETGRPQHVHRHVIIVLVAFFLNAGEINDNGDQKYKSTRTSFT